MTGSAPSALALPAPVEPAPEVHASAPTQRSARRAAGRSARSRMARQPYIDVAPEATEYQPPAAPPEIDAFDVPDDPTDEITDEQVRAAGRAALARELRRALPVEVAARIDLDKIPREYADDLGDPEVRRVLIDYLARLHAAEREASPGPAREPRWDRFRKEIEDLSNRDPLWGYRDLRHFMLQSGWSTEEFERLYQRWIKARRAERAQRRRAAGWSLW